MTFDPSANLEGEGLTGNTEAGHQKAESFKEAGSSHSVVVVELNQTDQRDDGVVHFLCVMVVNAPSHVIPWVSAVQTLCRCRLAPSPQVLLPRRQNWPTDDLAERRCSSLASIKIPGCSVLTLPVHPPTVHNYHRHCLPEASAGHVDANLLFMQSNIAVRWPGGAASANEAAGEQSGCKQNATNVEVVDSQSSCHFGRKLVLLVGGGRASAAPPTRRRFPVGFLFILEERWERFVSSTSEHMIQCFGVSV